MATPVPEISVVVPVFNEERSLNELNERLCRTLQTLGRTFEIVYIDDGSSDGSLVLMDGFRKADPRIRVVRLMRNFGQAQALFAGLSHSRGDIVAILDADLQTPPEELPKLLDKLKEGYDSVNGLRVKRKDTIFRKIPSRILNRVIGAATGVHIKDYGCSIKVFRRPIIDRLNAMTHRSRYLLVEVAMMGARIGEVEVQHQPRKEGESKYSFIRLLRLNFDIITAVTSAPLQLIGVFGWLLALVGFGMSMLLFAKRIIYGNYDVLASIIAIFFFIAGIQMVATGLMCEYIARIYVEVQNRPYYIVKEVLEGDDSQ